MSTEEDIELDLEGSASASFEGDDDDGLLSSHDSLPLSKSKIFADKPWTKYALVPPSLELSFCSQSSLFFALFVFLFLNFVGEIDVICIFLTRTGDRK